MRRIRHERGGVIHPGDVRLRGDEIPARLSPPSGPIKGVDPDTPYYLTVRESDAVRIGKSRHAHGHDDAIEAANLRYREALQHIIDLSKEADIPVLVFAGIAYSALYGEE